MAKRDRIFFAACGLAGIGLIFAIMGYELSLLLFVAAYLLRPSLHEFGFAKQYADERQLEIHSRSGNLAFIIVMLAIIGMVFWRLSDGQQAGELYTLIIIGLAARAITGLVMNGEYRKSGVLIISAIGLFLALFIVLEGGFSLVSLFGIVLGSIIIGFGQLSRKFPKTISIFVFILVILVMLAFGLFQFKRVQTTMWLFFVLPLLTASICLFLGSSNEEDLVSDRGRSIIFSSLGVGAVVVFAMLIGIGRGEEGQTGRTAMIPEGQITDIKGISYTSYMEYYQDGTLKYGILAVEDTISGQLLAAGTGVHFTNDGVFEWCFLQDDTEIQGYLCRGDGHGFMTMFHPNGKIQTAWLARDQVIQGVPCAKFRFLSAIFNPIHGKNGNTSFHVNGQLSYCELAENFTIEGQSFRRGDALWFDQDGNLVGSK